jgi:glucosamine kinase
MSVHYVGVDGGGTKTRALVVDAQGREVARAEGGPAMADASAPQVAADAVEAVVRAALDSAGVALPVAALWAGLSGAGREASRSAVELDLARRGLSESVRVGTDVEAAFHDAFGDGPGVLLISGTGSIAWGRAEDGREGRVGGWGHHIGDEGSGYAIGLEALRRVVRDVDGRAPDTGLHEAVLAHLALDSVEDLVRWADSASKAEVASLAPVVAGVADAGDSVAGEILVEAVEDLQGHLLTILTNLGPWQEPPRLALGGGLLQPGGPLRDAMERVVTAYHLAPRDRPLDGARGAARLAMAAGGVNRPLPGESA